MNRDHTEQKKRPRSVIADRLNRATAWVYRRVIHGPLGKLMTSYDRVEANRRKDGHLAGRGNCRPLSPSRQALLTTAENGWIFRFFRGLMRYLFTCPVSFYGLLLLFYSLAGVGLYFLPRLTGWDMTFPLSRLVICLLMALLSIPLAASNKPLSYSLGTGMVSSFLLVKFLGVPKDGLVRTERVNHKFLPYLALILALAAAVVTQSVSPLVLPAVLLLIGALGMIFAYPEVGVVLSTALLPTLCLGVSFTMIMVGVILLTWISFGIKWLFCHRIPRVSTMDIVALLLLLVVLVSGFTGATVTARTMADSSITFILMSLYFLIAHLMTSRAYIRRCFWGLSVSFALVLVLGCAKQLPTTGPAWISDFPVGASIVTGLRRVLLYLNSLWNDGIIFPIITLLPFVFTCLTRKDRLMRYVGVAAVLTVAGLVLARWGTPVLWVCALAALLIYAFLYSHRTLTVTLVAALPIGGILWWLTELIPTQITGVMQILFEGAGTYRESLWQRVWRMMLDFPGGIGWGEEAFANAYASYADPLTVMATGGESLYLELLTYTGWHGLLLFAVVMLLFFQKGFSAMRYTGNRVDRRMILAGISGVAATLLLGIARGMLTSPLILMVFWLIVALTSAYANVIFDECDVLMARRIGSQSQEDRVFRVGL